MLELMLQLAMINLVGIKPRLQFDNQTTGSCNEWGEEMRSNDTNKYEVCNVHRRNNFETGFFRKALEGEKTSSAVLIRLPAQIENVKKVKS